jgi:hypothetical protein
VTGARDGQELDLPTPAQPEIPSIRLGCTIKVRHDELEEYLERHHYPERPQALQEVESPPHKGRCGLVVSLIVLSKKHLLLGVLISEKLAFSSTFVPARGEGGSSSLGSYM